MRNAGPDYRDGDGRHAREIDYARLIGRIGVLAGLGLDESPLPPDEALGYIRTSIAEFDRRNAQGN